MTETNKEKKFKEILSSSSFDLNQNEPKQFVNMISKSISECLVDMGWDIKKQQVKISAMWSIVNPPGSSNQRHIHGNNFISAAYYVKAPKDSGSIKFFDPNEVKKFRHPEIENRTDLSAFGYAIKPIEGNLLIFPSYLYHSVGKNISNEDRIVISFNVDIKN